MSAIMGNSVMRLLFGIVLGATMIVGVAFISDQWTAGASTAQHRTMVNWDVVGENVRIVHQHALEMWSRLSHKVADGTSKSTP
jgi:lipopolysaccharide export LptBFGC system permease protein LptF